VTGVPLPQLALALPPAGAASARSLSPQQLGVLTWDDEDVLRAERLDLPPLRLSDGDLLVVRDRLHPAPLLAPAPAATNRRASFGEFPRTTFAPQPRYTDVGGLHIRAHLDGAGAWS